MLHPTWAKNLFSDNPGFRVKECLWNPVMSSNGKRQAVSEYLAGWVTGWIDSVDEDKKRMWGT